MSDAAGGKRHGDKGYYVEPTVFSNVTDDFQIAQEEIFGPVQSILKFDDLDDVCPMCKPLYYCSHTCNFDLRCDAPTCIKL